MEKNSRSVNTVTGASGHIGANLIRILQANGRRTRAVVHLDRLAVEGTGVETVSGDILNPDSLLNAFSGSDVVYHLAVRISLDSRETALMHRINVEGTKNVIDACLQAGVRRLVHFSSIHSLSSGPDDEPVDERAPLVQQRTALPYDRTKASSEMLVLDAVGRGLDAVIVNPTAVIGPHDYRLSSMGKFLLSLYQRKMFALVRGGFNWVDARDVAEGALLAESLGRCGERYLLGGSWLSLKDLAEMVREITGVRCHTCVFPMWLARVGAPFADSYARITGAQLLFSRQSLHALRHHRNISLDKACKELGYRPRPIRETLRDTLEWYLRHGYPKV
jgi:dihydroflavonol-4-reductase